jgi:hypothetical protein
MVRAMTLYILAVRLDDGTPGDTIIGIYSTEELLFEAEERAKEKYDSKAWEIFHYTMELDKDES